MSFGSVSVQFQPVADSFKQLFDEGRSRGCAVSAWWRGEQVLNLFGGWADRELTQPWQANTLVNVFSASKPFVAVAILQLVEAGKLDLDEPIAKWWPEFGKPTITVRLALNHRMGLPVLDEHVADNDIYDWPTMVAHMERMSPVWTPGEAQGYHPFVYGWVLGELIRRVSGQMPGEYIAEHVCAPLGIDFHLGLNDEEIARVAAVLPKRSAEKTGKDTAKASAAAATTSAKPSTESGRTKVKSEKSLLETALSQPPSLSSGSNREIWRRAQIPAANGHASAAALAAFYQAMLDNTLIGANMLRIATTAEVAEKDCVLGFDLPLGLGFWLQHDNSPLQMGKGAGCFGHPGAGGSVGFADPENALAFGFVTRDLGGSMLMGGKASRLAEAVYKCL